MYIPAATKRVSNKPRPSPSKLDGNSVVCEGAFFRIQFLDAKNGYTHSQHELLRTSDGGRSWQVVQVGHTPQFSTSVAGIPDSERSAGAGMQDSIDDFCFTDSRHGWLVEGAQLYCTSDGGRTLAKCGFDSVVVRSVWFATARDGWFVGEQLHTVSRSGSYFSVVVFGTNDGGHTWHRRYSKRLHGGVLWHIVGLTERSLLALGEPTLASTDGGRTWREMDLTKRVNDGEPFFGVPCFARVVDLLHALVYTNQGDRYLATEDGGRTWKVLIADCPWSADARPN